MKVTYFAYGVKDVNTENKDQMDIRPFMRSFCQLDSPWFKNSFIYNDEHLYLFHNTSDVFFFVMTKNNELIRKIDSSDISISGISQLLSRDEHIGFASYVLVRENYLGFASTIFAPKVDIFVTFINKLIAATGNDNIQLYLHALMYQASRQEAHEFSHIGTTQIEIGKENSKMGEILGVLGVDIEDATNLRGMQITLKPVHRQDIKTVVGRVMDEVPDDGLEKFMMRARAEVNSQTMDLYLTGKGAVSDVIRTSDESLIANNLIRKAESNNIVERKLAEYLENEEFDEVVLDDVLQYSDAGAWADLVSRLQPDEG